MTSIAFLESVNLAKYHAALAEAGASESSDFVDLDETDLREVGMKPVEIKRFIRTVGEAFGSDSVAF